MKAKSLSELRKIIPASAGEIRYIPDVTNAVASYNGRIWSIKSGKRLSIYSQGNNGRYVRVLKPNGKFSYAPIGVLVARAFLPPNHLMTQWSCTEMGIWETRM